ncbi:MAG: hypothetical protein QOF29_4094, partial [bacterium]
VLGVGTFSPRLSGLLTDPGLAVWFVLATMAWTIFVLQDAVLAGIRQAGLVPAENLVFSVLKIVLVVVLAAAAPVTGAFLSWSAPVVLLIIPVNLIVFRKLMPAHARATRGREHRAGNQVIASYLAADAVAYALWAITTGLLPLLVLNMAGAEASAQFFIVWAIAYALYLASSGMGQSLLAEASLDPAAVREHARQALAESLRLVVPAVAVVVVAAPIMLGAIGSDYGEDASHALRLLALSAIPHAVFCAEINVARAQRRMRFVVIAYAALCALVFALGLPLLHAAGITGLGAGWLVAQVVVAVALRLRGRVRVPGLRGRRLVGPLAGELDARFAGRRRGGGDVDVFLLDRAVVHVARGPRGEAALERRTPPAFPLAPRQLATGRLRGRAYTAESALSGTPGDTALAAGLTPEELLGAVHAAIRPLHEDTARLARIGERQLADWVDAPVAAIAAVLAPRYRPALVALRDELRDTLAGRSVALCTVHGDLWAGNVLLADGEVTGLVDWEASRRDGLAEVDRMHLLLTTRALTSHRELGDIVAETLGRRLGTDGAAVPARVAVLLAWLGHVGANLEKSTRYGRNPVWKRNNLVAVLDVVGRQAALNGTLPRAAAVPRAALAPAIAAGVAGVGLWALGVQATNWRAMSDLGLVSVLSPVAFVGLAALAAGFAVVVNAERLRPVLAGGFLVALVAVLHATPPLLYGTLRYSWAYKHVGIVDYILRHGGVDPSISLLPVYHDWPGFFEIDALITWLTGIPAMAQATWAPLIFNLLDIAALLYLLRGLTDDRRVHWRAAWIFFAASWIGQDYFAPQAFAFCLYLVLLGVVVRAPTPRRLVAAAALIALIAVSHPLTGVMMVIG